MSPLLTPSQFAQTAAAKKPGATYNTYRAYVTNTVAKRKAARAADPFGTLLSTFQQQLVSPAQVRAQANAAANTSINAQLAGLRASTKAAQDQAAHQAERAQGYARTLANMTMDRPEQVAQQYRDSANAIKDYGLGLTGQLGQVFNQGADIAAQSLTPGTAPVTPAISPEALKNSVVYSGVTIPGSTLQSQANSARLLTAAERQAAVGQVGDIAQQYLSKGTELQNQLAAKKAELLATRPDIYQKAVSAAQQAQSQNMATLMTALGLQGTLTNQQSQITARGRTSKASTTNAATGRARVTGINPKTGEVLPGFWRNPVHANGVEKIPSGMTVSADGTRLVPLPGKGSNKPLTPKDIQKMVNDSAKAAAAAKSAYAKVDPIFPNDTPTPTMPYSDAKRKLLQGYFPKKYWANKQVLQKIDDILTAWGYKIPNPNSADPAVNPRAAGPPVPSALDPSVHPPKKKK